MASSNFGGTIRTAAFSSKAATATPASEVEAETRPADKDGTDTVTSEAEATKTDDTNNDNVYETPLDPDKIPPEFQAMRPMWEHLSRPAGRDCSLGADASGGDKPGKTDTDAKPVKAPVVLPVVEKIEKSEKTQAETKPEANGKDQPPAKPDEKAHDAEKAKDAKPAEKDEEDAENDKDDENAKEEEKEKTPPPRPKVLRMPPEPLRLPPCLQCVLAGATCSLTRTPYRKAYANDRTDPDQRLTPAAAAPYWQDPLTSYARLVQKELNNDRNKNNDNKKNNTRRRTWEVYISAVLRQRQTLEQRFMKQAVARGSVDAPFWPPPPDQCVRCQRGGGGGSSSDQSCIQQTADLSRDRVARPAYVNPHDDDDDDDDDTQVEEVAWFASSGPPPLSLLPQHAAPVLDQIRFGQQAAAETTFWRHHTKHLRQGHVRLEAVFCRDPRSLSAKQVLARAQALLGSIADKKRKAAAKARNPSGSRNLSIGTFLAVCEQDALYVSWRDRAGPKKDGEEKKEGEENQTEKTDKGQEDERQPLPDAEMQLPPDEEQDPTQDLVWQVVRPATHIEISRMQPRWSRFNVYAGRGVATARTTKDGDGPRVTPAPRKKPPKIMIRGPRIKLPDWDPSTMMKQPVDEASHVRDLETMEDYRLGLLFDSRPDWRPQPDWV